MFAAPFQKMTNLFRNPRLGWVGLDISRNAIHMAQVEKLGNQYTIDARWTAFPSAASHAAIDNGDSPGEPGPQRAMESMIEQAEKARSLFSLSTTAFTIGDEAIDYREFDVKSKDSEGLDKAVESELEKELSFDFEANLVKAWELPVTRRATENRRSAAVVSADYAFTIWLGEMVTRAGYTPEVLDAIPCALARSAEMVLAGPEQSCLMVHLGDACTTLTQAQQGLPVVTRVLSHHGFENVLLPLGSEFALTPTEVYLLILKASQASQDVHHPSGELLEIVSEYQVRFVHSLAAEIYRTLEYLRAEQYADDPTEILVCGSGSVMPKVCEQLEQLIELPTQRWTIPSSHESSPGLPASLYTVAAGLSAIAWERS
jgi:Tfp pilus assembly PilM family ATPase